MPLDMLDDLGCTEIINTDENETVNTVDKSGVLDAAANVCENETSLYDETGFKMPQEILDDINCSVTSIPSVEELNASTNSDVKESSDYEETATVSHSNDTEHERTPCDELPCNSENALINLLPNVVQELEKKGKLQSQRT